LDAGVFLIGKDCRKTGNEMKVGLNATALLSPLTGVGQYTYHLAKGLQKFEDLELNMFYANGWSTEVRDKPIKQIRNIKLLLKKFIPKTYEISRIIQQSYFNERSFNKVKGIYHEPNFLAFNYAGPLVLTVHDLSWIHYPEMHPVDRVRNMNKHFQKSMERASMIITDSSAIKDEIVEMFGVADNRIKSIPLGVESLFRPLTLEESMPVLQQHGLSYQKYILAVGTLEPRKNLSSALLAYMQLPAGIRKNYPLVLVGMKGWHTSSLEKQMAPLVAAGEIRQLGYLEREDLAAIIAGALTLVYPSIYEGFGLPPLEAMTCGVPVIASNVSSLPEVVGDSGLLVNPHDIDDIAKAMETMITAPDIRAASAQKALARSAEFSWDTCVDQTVDIYRQVEHSM
jgi:glycosyltransferase involved in cell wall biosynthesis